MKILIQLGLRHFALNLRLITTAICAAITSNYLRDNNNVDWDILLALHELLHFMK